LQLVTEVRTFVLAAWVLRCAVWSLDPYVGVTYRGALKFEDRCELFWETETPAVSAIPAGPKPDGDCSGGLPPAGPEPAFSRERRSPR
jgi:hypothetical protein